MLSAGLGRAVITPDVPVMLAGFGARKEPATEVHDDLEAHAVVLVDGDVTVCLLVLDLLMLGPDVAGPLRTAVGAALDIPPTRVMTSCTHTHSGPAATASTRRIGWPMPVDYLRRLVDACSAAATAARAAATPVEIGFARGALPDDLSINRRGLPYDPMLNLLELRSPSGECVGTIAGAGIHPVALGITCRAVSGDWVTTFREQLARRTGAPAVLLPGALGDVNPTRDPHTDPTPGGNWDTAAELGTVVAAAAADLRGSAGPIEGAALAVRERTARVRAGLSIATVLSGAAGRRVDVELLEWIVGDVHLVSVPGEAFHALGRDIERARGDRAMIAGLAPAWLGYLPQPFRHGYEEKMSYGRRFVSKVGDLLTRPAG